MKRLYVWFDAVIGYLSASVEWAAGMGRAPTPGSSGGATRRHRLLLSWAKGQHRLPLGDLAGVLTRSERRRGPGRRAGRLRDAEPAREIVSSEFLTMSGSKFSTSRGT